MTKIDSRAQSADDPQKAYIEAVKASIKSLTGLDCSLIAEPKFIKSRDQVVFWRIIHGIEARRAYRKDRSRDTAAAPMRLAYDYRSHGDGSFISNDDFEAIRAMAHLAIDEVYTVKSQEQP